MIAWWYGELPNYCKLHIMTLLEMVPRFSLFIENSNPGFDSELKPELQHSLPQTASRQKSVFGL